MAFRLVQRVVFLLLIRRRDAANMRAKAAGDAAEAAEAGPPKAAGDAAEPPGPPKAAATAEPTAEPAEDGPPNTDAGVVSALMGGGFADAL